MQTEEKIQAMYDRVDRAWRDSRAIFADGLNDHQNAHAVYLAQRQEHLWFILCSLGFALHPFSADHEIIEEVIDSPTDEGIPYG